MGRVLAIGAAVAALSGCGTVQNFQRGSIVDATVYGGVDIAADRLKTNTQDGTETVEGECDVVLSVVGDTVTLPVTVTAEVIRAIRAARCAPPNAQPNPQRPPPPAPSVSAAPPPPSTSTAPPQPSTPTAPSPRGPSPAP